MSSNSSGSRARVEDLLSGASKQIRKAFEEFLRDMRSERMIDELAHMIESGDLEGALRIVDAHVARFGTVIARVFQSVGQAEVAALGAQLADSGIRVAIAFDVTNPRAVDAMRRNSLGFIREITTLQRDSIRSALVEGMQSGSGVEEIARALRGSIGLTETQRRSVENYRRLLELGDSAALQRGLRDRRFDSSVARAIESEIPLGEDQIDRMVERYMDRFLQYRAENIARTESLYAVGSARRESLTQTLDQLGGPRSLVVRTWMSTKDKRTRDTHAEMDGQQRGMDEPYESSSGARLMFPGDSSLGAPAEEIINCRCTELIEILPGENLGS